MWNGQPRRAVILSEEELVSYLSTGQEVLWGLITFQSADFSYLWHQFVKRVTLCGSVLLEVVIFRSYWTWLTAGLQVFFIYILYNAVFNIVCTVVSFSPSLVRCYSLFSAGSLGFFGLFFFLLSFVTLKRTMNQKCIQLNCNGCSF